MTKCIIKEVKPDTGRETKLFKSYAQAGRPGAKDLALGFAVSTTSNPEHGALHCAAKTFMALTERFADRDEIETRIRLVPLDRGVWLAELQPKG